MARRPMPRPTRAPAASKRPTPRPSTMEERAAGARANKQDPGPIARDMKAGGKVKKMAYGGKVKKMRAGGGNMSSESLRGRIAADSLGRDRNIRDTYRDRGTAGDRKMAEELRRELREYDKDFELIMDYGRDAPNARSFNTRRAAGGSIKKMAMGGKCRGMGAATKGGNYSRG